MQSARSWFLYYFLIWTSESSSLVGWGCCLPSFSPCFLHSWSHPYVILNQHETVLRVDLTACSSSSHGVWVFMLQPTSVFVLELSHGLVSFAAVYKEMLIWIACRGQCHGCRSDSYPSPWSSLPVNIITTHWKHTHSQQARTCTHTPTSCSSKSPLTD